MHKTKLGSRYTIESLRKRLLKLLDLNIDIIGVKASITKLLWTL